MTIQADLFIRFVALEKSDTDDNTFVTRKMPVYLGIFALAQRVLFLLYSYTRTNHGRSVFQFGMAIDAVYARNTLQFIALA